MRRAVIEVAEIGKVNLEFTWDFLLPGRVSCVLDRGFVDSSGINGCNNDNAPLHPSRWHQYRSTSRAKGRSARPYQCANDNHERSLVSVAIEVEAKARDALCTGSTTTPASTSHSACLASMDRGGSSGLRHTFSAMTKHVISGAELERLEIPNLSPSVKAACSRLNHNSALLTSLSFNRSLYNI